MSITNVEVITYGVDDVDASCRFWRDFGLTPDHSDPCQFSAQDGSTVVIKRSDDAGLPAAREPGSTLRHVVYGVDGTDSLAELESRLAGGANGGIDSNDMLHATDPLGNEIAFRVSRRRPVQAPELRFNTPGRPDRINTRGKFHDSAKPLELTHTVYMTGEPERVVDYYISKLGFIVSDCYPGRGYFMRGGASRHHHDLFILNVPGKSGFHHAAFELGSIHELFGGGLNMTRKGWQTALGPGRHPISSCYFWYFKCPSGGAAEYDFDSDIVDASWVPGEFEQTPENFAEWCLAEGMQESLLYKGVQGSRTAGK
ncbi:MAG TPA: VOC family protein [Gammaproteobacteria bacterium]|nr:VOC family protein [Gammaproteobacteria bacterium]